MTICQGTKYLRENLSAGSFCLLGQFFFLCSSTMWHWLAEDKIWTYFPIVIIFAIFATRFELFLRAAEINILPVLGNFLMGWYACATFLESTGYKDVSDGVLRCHRWNCEVGWAIYAYCRSEPFLAPLEAEIPLAMMRSVKFVKSLAWWPSGSLRGGGAKWMQWRAARGQPEPRELPGVTHSTARICGAQYGYRQLALFVFLEKLPGHYS